MQAVNVMKKFQKHFLGLLAAALAGAGVGWFIGTYDYARWAQQFAEMDAGQASDVLANVPLVKFEKSFDFGILSGKIGPLTHEFAITNTGRGVLKLSEPEIEDENVVCSLPKTEIAPDETMNVSVTCTPKEGETEFEHSVFFQTNAPTLPELELFVQGAVYPAVWPKNESLEVAGVPMVNVFKISNPVLGMTENVPLKLSALHVTDPQYAPFFEFELSEMYAYDFRDVSPAPASGQIVTITIKPGLPNKIFTVTVEGDSNLPDAPKVHFNIDFKAPKLDPILGTPAGFVPYLPADAAPTENSVPAAGLASEPLKPESAEPNVKPDAESAGSVESAESNTEPAAPNAVPDAAREAIPDSAPNVPSESSVPDVIELESVPSQTETTRPTEPER